MPAAAVIYVLDLPRMRAFYEACAGLSEVEAAERFCVLASGDWSLSLVSMPATTAASTVVADPPQRREQAAVKLVFDVESLDEHESLVAASGGHVDSADAAWEFQGFRHLDCLDPEANVIQLRERLAPAR
ncbi:MAG: glyoxalase/bleomycin resistance/dioxygenase family protein [Solirubrobacteraceae bacterium]